ncbi:MAG: gntK [Peptococcaceae bacterium]|jgi:gluconokinase|nr:gntK [Peptococcaceae bacterium]
MQKRAVIGGDIGTGSCKVVAFDFEGNIIGSRTMEYPLIHPRWGWAEQDPRLILDTFVRCLKELLGSLKDENWGIELISLSSVFHSVLAVDHQNTPLTNCLPWADSRALAEVEFIKEQRLPHYFYQRTGCPPHPMYLPGKLLWWKKQMPDVFEKAHKFISIKEYILAELTGEYLVDFSVASGSGLLNLHELKWDNEVLELIGINTEKLSTLVSTQTVLPPLRPVWAREMGLDPGTPWVIGGGDGTCSNLGSGAVGQGIMTAMVGTSGAVRVMSPEPKIDPQGRTWCYQMTDNMWVSGGAINNGGIVYRWYRDKIMTDDMELGSTGDYEVMNCWAQEIPPGSDGLLCLPFLAGERSPYWNANARGVLFGLGLEHTKKHVARAIMEGVVYRMYSVYKALAELNGKPVEIRASGGFARSPLWLSILSDVFGCEVKVPDSVEGSALGAAILGMAALKIIPSVNVAEKMVTTSYQCTPDWENHRLYQEIYKVYEKTYWGLQESFAMLAKMKR